MNNYCSILTRTLTHRLTRMGLLLLLVACGQATPQSVVLPTPPVAPVPLPAMSTPVVNAPSPPATLPQLDQFLSEQANNQMFSGAVLVAQNGQILLSKGYGLADRTRQLPNTPQTRFRLGSLTKPFTALAILQLQAQGKLDVQDPICRYLTDCPVAWQTITVHHLLTHTAGIPDIERLPEYAQIKTTPSTPAQTITLFQDKPLAFLPGTQWEYSSSGYILLGVILEQAAGKTYETFLQENIFAPLGMNDTGYEHDAATLATGYANATTVADPIDMSIPFAAGGLYSTVEDLYRWEQALATDELLPQPLLDLLFTPYAEIPQTDGARYGYGWVISQPMGHRLIGHNGGIDGFVASLNWFVADHVTIIMLSNQQNLNPNAIIQPLVRMIFTQ